MFRAYMRAEGPAALRAIWREEFKKWATDFDMKVAPRRGNGRSFNTTEFDVVTIDWPSINAFMLRWVGIDWIKATLTDRTMLERQQEFEMRRLRWQMKELSQMLVAHTAQTRDVLAR